MYSQDRRNHHDYPEYNSRRKAKEAKRMDSKQRNADPTTPRIKRSTKNLDTFFSRRSGKGGGTHATTSHHPCDISLCTATTTITKSQMQPATQLTWKRNPQAIATVPARNGFGLTPMMSSNRGSLGQNIMLVQVKEEKKKSGRSTSRRDGGESVATSSSLTTADNVVATSHLGGLTLGIANLLFQGFGNWGVNGIEKIDQRSDMESSRQLDDKDDISEAASYHTDGRDLSYATRSMGSYTSADQQTSELIIHGKRSVSCTFSALTMDTDESVEVSMPPISEGYELEFMGDSFLHRYDRGYEDDRSTHGAPLGGRRPLQEQARLAEERYMAKETRFEEHKRLVREKQLADEVQLVEMTRQTKAVHLRKDKRLAILAEQTKSAPSPEEILANLREQKRIFENTHLEEEKILEQEEKKLLEKRRSLKEAYLVEEARLAEETRRVEARLVEQARLAEERHKAEQSRLAEIGREVAEAREVVKQTRRLIEDEARVYDSLTFDESFSVAEKTKLHKLSEERSFDLKSASTEIEDSWCLSPKHWKGLNASSFSVRGKAYITDMKKVPSAPSLLRLLAVDLMEVREPIMGGFCSHRGGRVQKMLQLEKQGDTNLPESLTMPPFIFCMNMVLPGPPNYHLVMYFALDDFKKLGLDQRSSKRGHHFSELLNKFFFGPSDNFRNKVLKLIPRVTEGSFLLKTAVGTKPFILGKYLSQKFVRGERFLEVIVDVGSSKTTQKLLGLSSVYNSKIVAGLAFVLEANDEESLPENILCSVELNNDDFQGEIQFFDDDE